MAKDKNNIMETLKNLKKVDTHHVTTAEQHNMDKPAKVLFRNMKKYTKTINIPIAWKEKIEEHILKNGGFGTLSSYINQAIDEKMTKDGISVN